jgi:molybdenum cofactor cytidylyltransferase
MKAAGILLAAGAATRMERNKLLLRLGGEPLLRRAARSALAAGLDPLLVVLGHEADRARAALEGMPCQLVLNPGYARGINTSLSAGVAALPAEAAAAVVLLADMPFVDREAIAAVLARAEETGAPRVSARYGGVRAPPTLYTRPLFAELSGGVGEGRGREVARRHQERAAFAELPAALLADVDLPEDLERARRRLSDGGAG